MAGHRARFAVTDAAIETAVERVARDDGFLLCPEGGATLAAYELAREGA